MTFKVGNPRGVPQPRARGKQRAAISVPKPPGLPSSSFTHMVMLDLQLL